MPSIHTFASLRHPQLSRAAILATLCAVLAGCGFVAVETAPKKQATAQRTAASLKADEVFWRDFHAGDYEHIQQALDAVTGAYLQDPTDAVTASHVAWLHIWRASERSRLENVPPTITDDILLARRYFQEAVALNPADARYRGFLAATTLGSGKINQDEQETRRGYFELLDSISAWPEFNLFTAGYVMSQQPVDSPRFHQAIEWQWRTLDVCINQKLDRKLPDYSPYMSMSTTEGKKRVCWNSWIAPHNFEGFFLNMGDMLVASGEWQTAQILYANAKLSPTYARWAFRDQLEQRIVNAQANVEAFRATTHDRTRPQLMIAESFACMACHQQ